MNGLLHICKWMMSENVRWWVNDISDWSEGGRGLWFGSAYVFIGHAPVNGRGSSGRYVCGVDMRSMRNRRSKRVVVTKYNPVSNLAHETER